MFFRMMLWLLAKRFTWLVENDGDFRAAIANKKCVLQFQTRDASVQRWYAFAAGKVASGEGAHAAPTLTFTFASAASARNLILGMARDPSDRSGFMKAIDQGRVRLQGDVALLIWFMMLADYLAPQQS